MKEYKQKINNIISKAREEVIYQAHQAYQNGYEDGKADTPFTDTEEAEEKAYNRGLNEAWEAAKKIALMDTETSENVTGYFGLFRIMDNLTASEAIAKIKAYEDKQKQDAEIKVGDEVVLNANATYKNEKSIILAYDETIYPYNVLMSNGDTEWIKKDVIKRKTGRHFPQIAEILAELRGAENDE